VCTQCETLPLGCFCGGSFAPRPGHTNDELSLSLPGRRPACWVSACMHCNVWDFATRDASVRVVPSRRCWWLPERRFLPLRFHPASPSWPLRWMPIAVRRNLLLPAAVTFGAGDFSLSVAPRALFRVDLQRSDFNARPIAPCARHRSLALASRTIRHLVLLPKLAASALCSYHGFIALISS